MSVLKTTVAFLCFLAVAMASAGAAEPIVIKFSHVVSETTPKGIGANLFKERVEQRLGGRVRVEVYPRSQKFSDNEALLALLFGDIQMAAPSLSKFRSYSPALQVFDLPFLFRDVDHVHRFEDSVVGRQLLETMLPMGIRGLAYWDNGMRVISANKPLRVPADAKGLLFRIEPSAVFQEQWKRVGVVGIPMPFSRVVDAIREGLVEGQENAWSNIYSRQINALQKNFTELRHSFLGYMVVTNADFWEELPDDIRVTLEQILAEVTTEVNRLARVQAEADRRKVLADGTAQVIVPNEDERDLWRAAMTPVWKDFEGSIGKEVIDAAFEAGEAR